jgi:adenylate kinase family enzyme
MANRVSAQRVGLKDLGERICILGPSNSGKSTLAVAIGRTGDLPVIHLDSYRHLPGTNWNVRSDEEFDALHAEVLAQDRWVMDGNYSRWLPGRLARATGLIVLDASTGVSLARYVRRTLFDRQRAGPLEGSRDRLNLQMVRHIIGPTRANRRRYRRIFESAGVPAVLLTSRQELRDFYRRQHRTS